MSQEKYLRLLSHLLKFGILYMIGETVVYISGMRTAGLEEYWPETAVLFVDFYMKLWAAACFFMTLLLFKIYKEPQKYPFILDLMAKLSVLLGVILIYASKTPFETLIPVGNATLWIPYYSKFLWIEAAMVFGAVTYIWYGFKKKWL